MEGSIESECVRAYIPPALDRQVIRAEGVGLSEFSFLGTDLHFCS